MNIVLLALCGFGFFAGSAVKGLVGLGLPIVAVPILTLFVSLKTAVGLTVMPLLVSNLVQSFQGGMFVPMARRFWTLLVPLFVAIVISTQLLVAVPERSLSLFIGIVVVVLPLIIHLRPEIRVPRRHEPWLNVVLGTASGLLGGVSTLYGPPLMLYVLAMRLPKAEFVPAVSLLYFVGALALFVGVYGLGVAELTELGYSTFMLVPTGIGMALGQRLNMRLSERNFSLLLIAVYLVTGSVFIYRGLA
jgi:uncharacterized membrane protein YfcA